MIAPVPVYFVPEATSQPEHASRTGDFGYLLGSLTNQATFGAIHEIHHRLQTSSPNWILYNIKVYA